MDARATQARILNRKAQEAGRLRSELISQRNKMMRQLRRDDPQTWTYAALAKLVNISPEAVAKIIQGR